METEVKSNMDINENISEDRKLIGIDGHWYDVTSFIPHHPGGEIIERFIGKDASSVFHGFHKQSVLKYRKPYARMEKQSIENDKISQAFAHLGQYFEREGYFQTNYRWYAVKFVITFILFALVVITVFRFPNSTMFYFGAVALAAFWQQCGFFMHDFEHNQLTHNRHVDKWLGTFFGTICLGVSGSWWRKAHFTHHALTTCVDHDTSFADPQMMTKTIWAQDELLWPYYQSKLSYYCIRVQHLTFLPLCIFAGRFAILKASIMEEKGGVERAALLLHWVWVVTLFSYLPSWSHVFIFYGIAACIEGILHVQLLISHYAKCFHHLKNISTNLSWTQLQIESNIDIVTPWWLDWFHGGLNFHLVHHLYPRMPRHNYRTATEYVKMACEEHGLLYDHCGWFDAVCRTLTRLKLMSTQFTLDPR